MFFYVLLTSSISIFLANFLCANVFLLWKPKTMVPEGKATEPENWKPYDCNLQKAKLGNQQYWDLHYIHIVLRADDVCSCLAQEHGDLRECFSALQFEDLWDDAELVAAIRYVRGAKQLRIPAEWQGLLPSAL